MRCSAGTSRRHGRRSRPTAAPWRSSSATRSWPCSACPRRTRTTRSGQYGRRSTCTRSAPEADERLSIRIGISTGEVFAGGGGDALVTGAAVTLAKRLEQAARGGEVLVSAATQRLVRDAVRSRRAKRRDLTAFRVEELIEGAPGLARQIRHAARRTRRRAGRAARRVRGGPRGEPLRPLHRSPARRASARRGSRGSSCASCAGRRPCSSAAACPTERAPRSCRSRR